VYEGGGKVWECTNDVLSFMLNDSEIIINHSQQQQQQQQQQQCHVLDLGCGTGMLGTAALRQGAHAVTFSDLNASVLRSITCANVCVNGADFYKRARFIAGDWEALLTAAAAERDNSDGAATTISGTAPGSKKLLGQFQVILSSEILYRPEHYHTLCLIFLALLAPPNGFALIGTKRFYFGEGLRGGTAVFCSTAQSHGLTVKVVHSVIGDGLARDVIKVTREGGG
jgi:16S rRNA G966 N2-methylase RsmD